ncbi:MAG TPA: NYN domain-containing protein [Bacillota bacterium]|nr:NYN domain-containing protein [Bacillota bacterium]
MIIVIIDGYNMIGAWEELKRLKEIDFEQARDRLMEMLSEYQAHYGYRVIVVFDAYFVQGKEYKGKKHNVEVIFTKEKETADECIERLVKQLTNVRDQIYVATSDYAEQRTIFGSGALRKSARELYIELEVMQQTIEERMETQKKEKPTSKIILDEHVLKIFEKWRRGSK